MKNSLTPTFDMRQYELALIAHQKLVREVSKQSHDLRRLVGHAMLHDRLCDEITTVKIQEARSSVTSSLAAAQSKISCSLVEDTLHPSEAPRAVALEVIVEEEELFDVDCTREDYSSSIRREVEAMLKTMVEEQELFDGDDEDDEEEEEAEVDSDEDDEDEDEDEDEDDEAEIGVAYPLVFGLGNFADFTPAEISIEKRHNKEDEKHFFDSDSDTDVDEDAELEERISSRRFKDEMIKELDITDARHDMTGFGGMEGHLQMATRVVCV